MPQQRVRLIAGLGNPGASYTNTRHNAGFMVVDELADAFAIALSNQKFEAVFGRGMIDGVKVILAKPMAFMNRSGPPVQKVSNYFRILCEDMLVIHDDIDLAFGKLKIKEKGGDGGHKGVRSIIDAFGGGEFTRLRVGVGRSEAHADVTHHVLGGFNIDEKKVLPHIITKARDAVITILCKGTKEGMNRFNDRRFIISS
ncbi:MAG: aminoacyl-tRNA hydrolase [Deltaproteobacteria bacterium]|nr:aminoacyl-tRNA hydrolase [Deltaproteobacteria bacterium]